MEIKRNTPNSKTAQGYNNAVPKPNTTTNYFVINYIVCVQCSTNLKYQESSKTKKRGKER